MKMDSLIIAGIVVIMLGIALVVIGSLFQGAQPGQQGKDSKVKFSFVGLIGPFPLGFGNDKNLLTVTLAIAVVFMLAMVFLLRFGVWR